MRNLKLSSLALALMVAAMPFFQSCETDPCEDVVCTNGTATEIGDDCECVCDLGYEGVMCDTETRAKFAGVYAVSDNCDSSGISAYNVTIGPGTNINEVIISNFWDAFVNNVVATVEGNNITIARQEPDSDQFFVEGTGTIDNNVITWSYDISDETTTPIITDGCSATWTK